MFVDQNVLDEVLRMREAGKARIDFAAITGKEIWLPTHAGQVRALCYRPDGASDREMLPLYLNLHGGGFIGGLPEGDDSFCKRVCEELRIMVVSIDYRLAPEYPCPADKEDAYDAALFLWEHAAEWGIDPDRIAVGGHSAGGNIAAVVCQMAKAQQTIPLCCQILDYPPMDLATDPFEKFYTEGAIPPQVAAHFDRCYRSIEMAKEPWCSPIYSSPEALVGLPPAVVITCEIDSLRDEGEQYATMLIQAGVETTAKRFLGAAHGFSMGSISEPMVDDAQRMMIDGLRRYLFD